MYNRSTSDTVLYLCTLSNSNHKLSKAYKQSNSGEHLMRRFRNQKLLPVSEQTLPSETHSTNVQEKKTPGLLAKK